jgi:hypothetical protein
MTPLRPNSSNALQNRSANQIPMLPPSHLGTDNPNHAIAFGQFMLQGGLTKYYAV